MVIHVDFTGVQTEGGEAIPKGTYPMTVFDMSLEHSKDGNPYVQWEFKIDDEQEVAGGRHAWLNNSMQPQALWALKRTLLALGEPAESLEAGFDIDPTDFLGRPGTIVIGHQMYEGVMRSRVVRVLPPGEGAAGAIGTDAFGPGEGAQVDPDDLPFE